MSPEVLSISTAHAALAIGHDVEFVTLDSDFKAFTKDGLKLKLLGA